MEVSIVSSLRAFRGSETNHNGRTIRHEELGPSLTNPHLFVLFKLFAMYNETIGLIPDLFEWVKSVTNISFTPRVYEFIIMGFAAADRAEEAVTELQIMQINGIKPTVITRTILIDHFSKKMEQLCSADDVEEIRTLFRYVRENEVYLNTPAYNAAVEAYIRNDKLNQARDVLYKMSRDGQIPEKKYFAELVSLYVKRGDYEEAKGILYDMDACRVHVPRALSEIVSKELENSGDKLGSKEVQEQAEYRAKLKHFNRQLHETYKN